MTAPKFAAVVEVRGQPSQFWLPLPVAPWPQWVELSADTPQEHIALVMQAIAQNPGRANILSPEKVAHEDNLPALHGGIAVSHHARTINPSCCCFLNDWREWTKMLNGDHSPWLGHDPSPWVERYQGNFYIWPDEYSDFDRRNTSTIRFNANQLREATQRIQADLENFRISLAAYLESCQIQEATAIARAFKKNYIDGDMV